jgi:hypothetical protein
MRPSIVARRASIGGIFLSVTSALRCFIGLNWLSDRHHEDTLCYMAPTVAVCRHPSLQSQRQIGPSICSRKGSARALAPTVEATARLSVDHGSSSVAYRARATIVQGTCLFVTARVCRHLTTWRGNAARHTPLGARGGSVFQPVAGAFLCSQGGEFARLVPCCSRIERLLRRQNRSRSTRCSLPRCHLTHPRRAGAPHP